MPTTLSHQHTILIHQTYPRLVAGRHQLLRVLRFACHDTTLDAELLLLRFIGTAVATLDVPDELYALLHEARHAPLIRCFTQADPLALHHVWLHTVLGTLGHEHTAASADAWARLLWRLLTAMRNVAAEGTPTV